MSTLSVWWRIKFIWAKYFTLVGLLGGRARLEVAPLWLTIGDVSALGTLQSRIVDFFEDIACACDLGKTPVVIDVGANVGQFACAVKLFYPDARVICFEPDPGTFAKLRDNTTRYAGVELHNVGLGERPAVRTFYRSTVSEMSSFKETAVKAADRNGTASLPIQRLDDMIGSGVRPDLLKIDVEGFEREVLEGGWETLCRSRYLLIEVSLTRSEGKDNLRLLRDIIEHAPAASVLRFGRLLGDFQHPIAQDVVISIQSE